VIGKDDVEAGTKFLVAQRTMTAEVNAFTLLLGKTLLPVLTVLFVKLENFPIVMKEIGLSLAQLASYIAGPVGMLANWLIIEPKLTKAHKEMDQAMTDALVALDKEVHAALAAGIAHDLEGKAVTTATHAVKEHAAALRELAPVFPPVVEAMLRIQQTHAAEEIHAQAQALLDFGKAAQMPTLAIPPLAPLMAYTDGFKQLTAAQVAALPTEREIRTIHQDLAKLFPNMTQEEVDAKTAELARNTGLLQLIVQSAELTKGTKLYRQEMQQVIQTIRQLSGVEDPLVEKMREMLVTQQQVNQGMLQMADATMKAGFAAAMYGESIGRAMEKAAKAALASIAEQAGVNALNALAYGAWYLAQAIFGFGDPNAAAAAGLAFEAAAEWGAIAGVAGAAAAAMPSGGGGAGSSRGAAAGAGRGAGGGQAIERGGAGGGSNGGGRGGYSQTTIHIDGVISPDNMAQVFTQAGVGAGNGLFKFTASGVSGIPAPRA
jgi:hypothetical protein